MESEETNTENDEATPSREDVSGGPGDISKDESPYHSLSNPVGEPDPTEWPDPFDKREDPRDPPDPDGEPFGEGPHPASGSRSTSAPHPREDIEAGDTEPPERDKLDE